jgi:ABC-type uncharacterized transport system permease subunit
LFRTAVPGALLLFLLTFVTAAELMRRQHLREKYKTV